MKHPNGMVLPLTGVRDGHPAQERALQLHETLKAATADHECCICGYGSAYEDHFYQSRYEDFKRLWILFASLNPYADSPSLEDLDVNSRDGF